jgi:hypothetical protein
MDTGMDYIVTKYVSIRPEEKRNMFPANDVPFTFVFDGNQSDEFWVKEHFPTWKPHIHLKNNTKKQTSLFYKLHPQLKKGDVLHITQIEPMNNYRLEILK